MTAPRLNASRRPAAQAAGLPTPAPGVRVVGCGVDTLHLFSRAPVHHVHVRELEQAQRTAKAWHAESPSRTLPSLVIADRVFTMQAHGARTAPFLLEEPDVAALLVAPAAAPGFPTWKCELRALHLWQVGVDEAVAGAERLAAAQLTRATDEAAELHVGRLDLAVDFQGWTPLASEGFNDPQDESLIRYVTRAQDYAAHAVRRRFTGFMFGRGDVACRLYNKTVEAERSGKGAAMRAVWKGAPGYVEGEPVWRLEYQLRRPAIAALRVGDDRTVSTWTDLRAALRGLWLHLSTRWLVRRAPRTRTSRQGLTPEWSALSREGFARGPWQGTDADVHRLHRQDVADRLTPQLAGYLARALAEEVYFAPDRGIGVVPDVELEDAMPAIIARVRAHTTKRGTSPEEKAEQKVGRWDEARIAAALAPRHEDAAPDEEEAA